MIALIEFFTALTFITSAFGQLERLEFFKGAVNAYLFEVPLLFTLALLVLKYKWAPFQTVKLQQFANSTRSLVFVLGVILVGSLAFFPMAANAVAGLYFARFISYIVFIIYIVFHCSKQKELSRILSGSVLVYVGITILSAALQYCYYPDLRNLFYDGWDPHYYRLFGLFLEPVIAAAVYGVICIFFAFAQKIKLYIRVPIALVFFVMLIMTLSRAAWLALFITVLIFGARNRFLKLALVGVVVAAIVFVIIPKPSGEGVNILRTSTILSRAVDYQEGILIWQRSPIVGIGYNHISAIKHTPQTDITIPNHAAGSLHSSFLIILATGGVIGLLFFLNWLVEIGRISEFTKYAVIFLSVVSLFDNVLLHPFVLVLIAVLGGISVIRPSSTSV